MRVSYIRTEPSEEQVRKSLLTKGEQEMPRQGPMCFSKLAFMAVGKRSLILGLAW